MGEDEGQRFAHSVSDATSPKVTTLETAIFEGRSASKRRYISTMFYRPQVGAGPSGLQRIAERAVNRVESRYNAAPYTLRNTYWFGTKPYNHNTPRFVRLAPAHDF
ncbi:hypothetical protein [Xanthomonas melonis]|uniref:hypothetical protein n=1 Tax=Xanthomonas melonis TaxID=56456 RepID=UPI003EBEB04F